MTARENQQEFSWRTRVYARNEPTEIETVWMTSCSNKTVKQSKLMKTKQTVLSQSMVRTHLFLLSVIF